MNLAAHDQCTGCGACMEICPKQAIVFKEDEEGFPAPVIQAEKCVECGLCNQVCPAIHMPETKQIRAAYAAQIRDQAALRDSTSGGLFTAFAREIFRRGGVVYGCVWDREYNAVVVKAESEEEMRPMRGSKYVWSWAGDTFREIEAYLKAGRTVMFTGLPCQAAGLKKYLREEYSNLFLVTFFCGGAPSPYALHQYLKIITRDVSLAELNLNFRDKDKYGVGVHITYNTRKGKVYQTYLRNPYFFSYHIKLFHRPSCYHCQYRYRDRIEDITIGDYWGVRQYHTELDVKAGVSALLVNSEKGAGLFDAVKKELDCVETKVEYIAAGNNLTLSDKKRVFHAPAFRNAFFVCLKNYGWKAAEKRYLLINKQRIVLWIKRKIPKKILKTLVKVIH